MIEMTNKKFAETNEEFREVCAFPFVDLKPTTRQASKWRNKKGKAYKAKLITRGGLSEQ